MAEGVPISTIVATIRISRRNVYKWVRRFLMQGIEGLADKQGRGHQRVASTPAVTKLDEVRVCGACQDE
jgi:transposase